MVISEFYRLREDGVNLYKIYSDEGFEIENIKTKENFADVIEDSEIAILDFIETKRKIPVVKFEEEEQAGGN